MNWMQELGKYTKAVVAGLISGYAIYQVAKGAASPAGVGITFDEWVGIASTGIFVAVGTWAVPNAKSSIKTETTEISMPPPKEV